MIKKVLKENIWYLLTLVLLIVICVIVVKSSYINDINKFDQSVIKFIISILDDRLTSIFEFLTFFGDIYIPIVILMCIFLLIKNKWYFYLQSVSYLIAGIITYLTKILAGRERPLEALIEIPSSKSFPSGHTLTSIVFYLMLIYLLTNKCSKRVKIISFICGSIFVLLIAFSRVYLGVHYCSDVVGGIIFGIPCLLMLINVISKNYKKKLK